MTIAVEPNLKLKSLIPGFHLPTATRGEVNVWDYKGRKNLMLAFFPGGPCRKCEEFVEALKADYGQYDEENTQILVVFRDAEWHADLMQERFAPPFPILYDETGKVTDSYAHCLPAIFVADRFGELYAQWTVGPDGDFPEQKQFLDVLDLINLECPE